ncbi:MAG: CPBP family intramembrane glutamic endopeptidase [Candidatus Promineifilaceae bacterium]|nr:CPBP family intramembrane glutamic endopeptidase [Candidatus Promineifilaceae bacterium]
MITIGGIEFDLKLTFLIIYSTVVPMLDYYNHQLTGTKAYDRFIFYFIIPMLIIFFVFREPPKDFGFQLGDWRSGLIWVAIGCVGMAIILWFVSRMPAMQEFYSERAPSTVGRLIFLNGVELFAWEFMWRGIVLFVYARYFGPGAAIFLQAIPFAFMHLGKPEIETISTIFGGAAFGFVAWQTQSFVYPWLIHWFIASLTMVIATGRI